MFTLLLNTIDAFLLGQSTLEDLENWLVEHLQDILDSSDQRAIDMANQVDSDLVEYGENIMNISTLVERLQSYVFNARTLAVGYTQMQSTNVNTIYDATQVEEHQFEVALT